MATYTYTITIDRVHRAPAAHTNILSAIIRLKSVNGYPYQAIHSLAVRRVGNYVKYTAAAVKRGSGATW